MFSMDNSQLVYWSIQGFTVSGVVVACVLLHQARKECNTLRARLAKSAAASEEMKRLALYDWLTGLPNRLLLEDRIHQAIAKAQREQSCFVVLFLDLDRFKLVNDKFGHAAGDLLLNQLARRLSEHMRQQDTVARIGGDEFVIVADAITSEDILAIVEKVARSFIEPFHVAGHPFHITASIGHAQYPADGESIEDLLSKADGGMYVLKNEKRLEAEYMKEPAIQMGRF